MRTLEITVPNELADELQSYHGRMPELLQLGLQQLRIGEALALYESGAVSLGRAVELAGVSRESLTRHALAAGIAPPWSDEMVHQELA